MQGSGVQNSSLRVCREEQRAVEESGTLSKPPPPLPLGQAPFHDLAFRAWGKGSAICGDPPQFIGGFPPLVCGRGGSVGERTLLGESNKTQRKGGRPSIYMGPANPTHLG